jgi:hypothetical protein
VPKAQSDLLHEEFPDPPAPDELEFVRTVCLRLRNLLSF